MSTLLHLLKSCRPGLALALALLVAASSLCPRGWALCLHDADAPVLVGSDHRTGDAGALQCERCAACEDDDCLDLALALIGDLQTHQAPPAPALPTGAVLAVLPTLACLAQARPLAPPAWTASQPPTPLTRHVSLQV
jgi:hypothetical protein